MVTLVTIYHWLFCKIRVEWSWYHVVEMHQYVPLGKQPLTDDKLKEKKPDGNGSSRLTVLLSVGYQGSVNGLMETMPVLCYDPHTDQPN